MIKMWLIVLYTCFYLQTAVFGLWDKEIKCPRLCTCRLEHITETAIHRFMQQDNEKDKQPAAEAIILESNDVFYDDDFDSFDESSFIRSATCIVQTETKTEELINELPKEIQSVTLIQASDSGNKSIKFSYFSGFAELKIIELQSAQKLKKDVSGSYFVCEVDSPIQQLEYLNLERVLLKNSKNRHQLLEIEANGGVVTFEYIQKKEDGSHPLTFIHRGTNDKILPYKTYVENQKNDEFPLFIGFSSLILLRIYECELNSIHWEMFEDLNNLNYLILEKNNLRFVPDFAFYGTPNLKSLSLAWNNLLNIQITDLAGLLELEYLDLSHNNFSQLSELSLPPFPKLKLANFANNPITVVFPNTFEVMNTTDSLILGGSDEPLTLLTNSFLGLKLLKTLKLLHLNIPLLIREILVGMPNLKVLSLTGDIAEIQYDAFLEVINLESLLLSKCNISVLSMDSFYGLSSLRLLDLSKNNLETIPPGTFDDLKSLKELYLNNNKFKTLPRDLFSKTYARLIRLNENPWNCSCEMSDWKPLLVNRIKQKSIRACENHNDKGTGCTLENSVYYKYVYETRVAPKCSTPKRYQDWSVFHVMRKQFKCPEFKPKLKKKIPKHTRINQQKIINIKTTTHEEIQRTTSLPLITNILLTNKTAFESINEKPEIKNNSTLLFENNIFQSQKNYNETTATEFKNHNESHINNNKIESKDKLETFTTQATTSEHEENIYSQIKHLKTLSKHINNTHKLEKLKRKLALELKYKKTIQSKLSAPEDVGPKDKTQSNMQESTESNEYKYNKTVMEKMESSENIEISSNESSTNFPSNSIDISNDVTNGLNSVQVQNSSDQSNNLIPNNIHAKAVKKTRKNRKRINKNSQTNLN